MSNKDNLMRLGDLPNQSEVFTNGFVEDFVKLIERRRAYSYRRMCGQRDQYSSFSHLGKYRALCYIAGCFKPEEIYAKYIQEAITPRLDRLKVYK